MKKIELNSHQKVANAIELAGNFLMIAHQGMGAKDITDKDRELLQQLLNETVEEYISPEILRDYGYDCENGITIVGS